MPSYSFEIDGLDYGCPGTFQDRRRGSQESHSSDDDSEVSVNSVSSNSSSLGSDDLFFEELNAFLGGNGSEWLKELNAIENEASLEDSDLDVLKNTKFNPGEHWLFDLLVDDNKLDLSTNSSEPSVDDPCANPLGAERLYSELPSETLTSWNRDFVVLGVGLQTLSSSICDDFDNQCLCSSSTNCPSDGHHRSDRFCSPTIYAGRPIDHYIHSSNHHQVQNSRSLSNLHQQESKLASSRSVAGWYHSLIKTVPNELATNQKQLHPQTVNNSNLKASTNTRCRRQNGRQSSKMADDERTFPCPYAGCVRVYSKNSHLRAHLRRHTGEKPFVCQWPNCKWRFSRSDELARHKRSHSGVKPYQCSICAKRFGRSDHLAKHVRIHRRQGIPVPGKGSPSSADSPMPARASMPVEVQIIAPCK